MEVIAYVVYVTLKSIYKNFESVGAYFKGIIL